MERTEVLELMATLKLYGMRAAYDEMMATGIKRRDEPPRIVGDLLSAVDLPRFGGEASGHSALVFSNCAGLLKSRAECRRTGL